MALVRTNVTLPEELLRAVDELAGPRGRSQYVAEAVEKRVKRDRLGKVLHETAGVLVGTPDWLDGDQALALAKEMRAGWNREP